MAETRRHPAPTPPDRPARAVAGGCDGEHDADGPACAWQPRRLVTARCGRPLPVLCTRSPGRPRGRVVSTSPAWELPRRMIECTVAPPAKRGSLAASVPGSTVMGTTMTISSIAASAIPAVQESTRKNARGRSTAMPPASASTIRPVTKPAAGEVSQVEAPWKAEVEGNAAASTLPTARICETSSTATKPMRASDAMITPHDSAQPSSGWVMREVKTYPPPVRGMTVTSPLVMMTMVTDARPTGSPTRRRPSGQGRSGSAPRPARS